MKILKSHLLEKVDAKLNVKQLEAELTRLGLEVESIEKFGNSRTYLTTPTTIVNCNIFGIFSNSQTKEQYSIRHASVYGTLQGWVVCSESAWKGPAHARGWTVGRRGAV